MTEIEVRRIVNRLKGKVKIYPQAKDLLNSLTDNELMMVIALDTYNFGRSWKNSLANAQFHLQDRERAIRLFSHKND